MKIGIREAAALLGRHPRTIRNQIARGVLTAQKVQGSWQLELSDLPLTDAQRKDMDARIAEAAQDFDPSERHRTLRHARSTASRLAGLLLMHGDDSARLRELLELIETRILPSIGGLLRWTEGQMRGSRRSSAHA